MSSPYSSCRRQPLPTLVVAIACIVSTLGACKQRRQTVVIDGWWGADSAEQSCERANEWYRENAELITRFGCDALTVCKDMMPQVVACGHSAREQYFEFETELSRQFAANARCKSVRIVRLANPAVRDRVVDAAMEQSHWLVGVTFTPGAAKQSWWLTDPKLQRVTDGDASPREIADTVCGVVSPPGAELAN